MSCTNAAVLLRNSPTSGTCSQRITAVARSWASWWRSGNVPAAAYTSIIGVALPRSDAGEPVARRSGLGGGLDEPGHLTRMGDHRDMARGHLDRAGAHALREHPLRVRRDRLVFRRDEVPRWMRL